MQRRGRGPGRASGQSPSRRRCRRRKLGRASPPPLCRRGREGDGELLSVTDTSPPGSQSRAGPSIAATAAGGKGDTERRRQRRGRGRGRASPPAGRATASCRASPTHRCSAAAAGAGQRRRAAPSCRRQRRSRGLGQASPPPLQAGRATPSVAAPAPPLRVRIREGDGELRQASPPAPPLRTRARERDSELVRGALPPAPQSRAGPSVAAAAAAGRATPSVAG